MCFTAGSPTVDEMEILLLVNIVGTDEDTFDRHLAIKLYREQDGFRSAVNIRQAHRGNYRAEKVSGRRSKRELTSRKAGAASYEPNLRLLVFRK